MGAALRVAFVSHSTRLYGASRSLLAVLQGLRAAGIETLTIVPGPGPMAQALAARGLAFATVPFPCWVTAAGTRPDREALAAAQARAVPRIVELLRAARADVVWSNSSITAVGALAADALVLPHVWHLRELSGEGLPFRFVDAAAAARRLRAADARIAVSAATRATFEAMGSGACAVVYNGIGAAQDLARRPVPARRGAPLRLLLPARVRAEKGQLVAIAAVRLLRAAGRDVVLRLVGDGDLRACAAAIARAGVADAVTLAGFVADVDAEYRQADVVLSCSRIEAMGRTTAEAMSYGLPVVGCDRLGTAELIRHGDTGLLCDGSPAALARAVEQLIAQPDAAREFGRRAQAYARQHFTDERCTEALLAVLRRVCARPAPPPQARAGTAPSASDW